MICYVIFSLGQLSGLADWLAPWHHVVALASSEADVYSIQMLALTEHLQRMQREREERRNGGGSSPSKGMAGGGGVTAAGSSGTGTGTGSVALQGRVSHTADGYRLSQAERDRDSILHGQVSVAAMQQRLQHKFGEEAAAFMLHDLKQVPEHLHVLFYMVILQLRELPSPLPASLGEAYYAVFAQHFDRTVSAAERRHTTFRTQVAQLQVQTQVQLEAMQQKVTELSPRGARPTAQAQLQQLQKHVQQQAVEHQAQLKMYAAQAIAAQELHTQVMRLLCVAVAAQERLSTTQLAAMGFEGVLQHLPAWEVLFHVRDGVMVMADPSLESWLMDKRVAKQFTADPRVGHAVLGHHYRQVAERDVRALDTYGLRYAVLHLLLSDEEVTGGERLLMDAEYMEQVFRCQEEGTLYLTLLRLTHKTEVVSEVLRWLRHNMGALRAFPRAVMGLWQSAPSRTLLARLVAAAEGRTPPSGGVRSYGSNHQNYQPHGAASGGTDHAKPGATRPSWDGDGNAAAAAGGGGGALTSAGGSSSHTRPSRPQCKLLNPPPFWPAAITHLPGHNGGVTGLVFDRRNRLLAAATAAGTVLMWDHATARCVGTLTGYSPSVPCVDLHPQGRLLAVGSSTDSAVRVRALDSGSGPLLVFSEPQPDPVLKTLLGPRNAPSIRHMSYSPDGHLLAVVYGDGTVTVWDPVKGLLALACANGTIRVWHLERLNPLHISVLRAYDNNVPIRAVHYSPSGLLLASLAEGAAEVLLWDVASGNQLQVLQGPPGAAPARRILYKKERRKGACAGDDGEVCVWNASTRGQWFQAASLRGHSFAVNALAFSPCGLVLATGGNEDGVRLWDMGAILHRSEAMRADQGYGIGGGATAAAGPGAAAAGAAAERTAAQHQVTVIRGDEAASSGRHPAPGVISCLTHNPSGTQLAAGLADGGVVVWDAVSPRRWVRLVGDHGRPVGRVIYSSDGNLLASASDDGCICIWNTSDIDVTGTHLLVAIQADAALGGRLSHDGFGAGGGAAPSRATTAWLAPAAAAAAAAGASRRHGPGAGGWVTLSCSVAFAPRGSHLASAHDDGTVLLWALPSGALAARLQGHARLAYGLQYSQDGRLLATWSDDGTLCLWSPEAALRAVVEDQLPQPIATLQHRDHVYDVDFAPNNAPSLASISRDGSLRTWDIRTASCTASASHGHGTDSKDSVEGVRYSPTGLLLATWSSLESLVRLWHAASCTLLREISGLQLMAWAGLGPGPWAAVLRTDYAPFVVRLPERALMMEAAAIDAGVAPDSSPEYLAAAEDETAEGLTTAAVGLSPLSPTGPAAQRRLEQLQVCRQLSFRPAEQSLTPVVAAHQAAPLRPCVRIFSGTRSVPHVTLRGRSLVLADNSSTAFYSVTHDTQPGPQQQPHQQFQQERPQQHERGRRATGQGFCRKAPDFDDFAFGASAGYRVR
ncbi:hypothetical protein VOLCADRAFT_103429 [Volvox carteri f. nagariensis]|uniref:TANC1/2-like winged helix domain-containing protein n=1 Tax=Volvox carteri f. nagariensis TaxID=3068 RepID=D8TLT1_VOLCA|nr:uncharacterized protein VOLCADRAFT_103429 [Volvox carteri f. nagariensis]EFJ51518.1 hypothetical protein VOLCADRAFT_103429 [Volvox carteri f. nagariensis]|eukprot:XP_002947470.1 hypothetical protein VOLCADRAFT_103429 [Volvox carteri f. nagariensis]